MFSSIIEVVRYDFVDQVLYNLHYSLPNVSESLRNPDRAKFVPPVESGSRIETANYGIARASMATDSTDLLCPVDLCSLVA
jgi:hypothetical protein